ncbi:cytochrome b subunit of succinate dehydrogenase, Sdh3p [Marasmius crinis-equi]|uniref:Cytochrome b subunit of succinate dehydrogenase, Sdh3p n=1 Tax=Marasmius crinis-equi TaxID=585013 RepID=A0ABR3FWC3_9AGAR
MLSTRAVGLGPSLRQATFTTESHPPQKALEILNQQRLKRPSSPHFTIYQPQLTWIGSIFNRVTGGALSALLYGFSLAYLVAPGTFDSASIIGFVSGLPEGLKYAGKALLALPFTFHAFNGVRHLLWDTGKFMTVKGAYSTGYAVLGATAAGTAYLTFFA